MDQTKASNQTRFVYYNNSYSKIIDQKDFYIKQYNAISKKIKGLTHIHTIVKNDHTGEYCLTFIILKKDSNTVKVYNKLLKESSFQKNLDYLNNLNIQC